MKRRKLSKFLKVLYVIVLVYVVIAIVPKPKSYDGINPLRVENNNMPILIAHGGGNQEFPDNTLEAFYNAYSIDQNVMMETDVSLTKDGVVILSHDTTLDRKTNLLNQDIIDVNYSDLLADKIDFNYHNKVEPSSNGYNVSGDFIRYRNYLGEEVTPLDVNYPEGVTARDPERFLVTSLEDLIKAFPNNRINVEIKQTDNTGLLALDAVLKLMDVLDDDYNTYSRIVVASFHNHIYDKFVELQRTSRPKLMYSPSTGGVVKFYILQLIKLNLFYFDNISVLQVPMAQAGINLNTKSFIRSAHNHNIAVHYWTINDEEDMIKLIENGADGIMTDRPSLLKETYNKFLIK